MKTFVIVDNYEPIKPLHRAYWYFLADSAISNTGKPFYLPENLGKTIVHLGIVLKIDRLGKGIHPEYASRYYSEYAPALHFTLPDYENRLKECDLPLDGSRSFDRSLIVGEFRNKIDFQPLILKVNGEPRCSFEIEKLHLKDKDIIFSVSQMNTLKMGDFIVPGLNRGSELKEGDFIEVFQGVERSFHVKVK